MVRSKICGITRIEDALLAAEAGADAIGLVFYSRSPRSVGVREAKAIVRALPPFVSTVGLFVNASRSELHEVLDAVPLDWLQFHGDESPAQCEGHHRPWIKALRVVQGVDLRQQAMSYTGASAILLDAHVPGLHGGTGATFDWSQVPRDLGKPLILAGGLTPENVQQAIAQLQPYAVDVSGGVEAAKGIKDPARVRAFLAAVRQL